jgi:hypothetical protein
MKNQDIFQACQSLVQEGKQPTVALIKTRLTTPLPLPSIIAGLKAFQANPKVILKRDSDNQASCANQSAGLANSNLSHEVLVNKVLMLEQQVAELKQSQQKLEARLAILEA